MAGESLPFIACENTSDCGGGAASECVSSDEDFRLVFDAGTCDGDIGESCTIGFCADTGAACGGDDDCEGDDTCKTGFCAVAPVTTSSNYQTCETDSNCGSEYDTCIDGVCSSMTAFACVSDCSGVADTDETGSCIQSAITQTGTCVNNNCLLQPNDTGTDGEAEPFSYDTSEILDCRGWPETTSPFPNEVVEDWLDATDPSTGTTSTPSSGISSRPYEFVSTYDKVNTCVYGEDCLCSYEKVQYGSVVKYFDQGTTPPDYLCVGGVHDGAVCEEGNTRGALTVTISDCETTGGGLCTLRSGQQAPVGLDGYCLERDTALTVNADRDSYACLAWLPIDRPSGASDIYGKSTEAGYPLTDAFYCAEPRMYVDLTPSIIGANDSIPLSIACAETHGDCTTGNRYDGWDNVACPAGYFGVVGRCGDASGGNAVGADTYAYQCIESTPDDNDQPYFCVPEGAYHVDPLNAYFGEACANDPRDISDADIFRITSGFNYGDAEAVYQVIDDDPEVFDALADSYADCYVRGVEFTEERYEETFGTLPQSIFTDGDSFGFHYLELGGRPYMACESIVQVASTKENFAWTDRLLFDGSGFAIDGDAPATLAYTQTTTTARYGASVDPNTQNGYIDPYPVGVAQCITQDNYYQGNSFGLVWDLDNLELPTGSAFASCTTTETGPPWFLDNAAPEARSFVELGVEPDEDEGGDLFPWNYNYNGDTTSTGLNRINEIFARVLDASLWSDGDVLAVSDSRGTYSPDNTSWTDHDGSAINIGSFDATDTGDTNTNGAPSGPVIRAVGSVCVGQYCREGKEGTFSVNGRNSINQTGTGGQFLSDLKFFVEANPNQMPIRRVIVDWQDDSGMVGSITDDNYYKNRRGMSETNQQFCDDTTADNWGETSAACESNYFNVQHVYTCSATQVDAMTDECGDSDGDGNLDVSPCRMGDSCAFQPRVHVRDNWGWCTGVCPDTVTGTDGTAGCYDDDGDISSSTDINDECDLNRPNNPEFPSEAEDNPWVYYEGVIVVEP